MLVLSRKRGERIRIGHDIEIVVSEVRGGQVRLGFSAPPGVAILREEIYRAIVEENERAALPSPEGLRAPERALQRR